MGRYLKGNVDEELGLGTLAARTLVGVLFDETVNERTLVTSVDAIWSLDDLTQSSGVGPILCGFAHGDYTDTEVEEYIEQVQSWNEGDKIGQEIARRQIRLVGTFSGAPIDAKGMVVLNDGMPIKTKCNWILNQGQTLRMWAYNTGSQPLATTTPVLRANGHANLFPK